MKPTGHQPARPGIDYLPDGYVEPPRPSLPLWLRAVALLLLYALLQWLWSLCRGSTLEAAVIDMATVQGATALINLLTPAVAAVADGSRVRAAGGGINVLNGCDGTEILFLLWAGLLVAPLSWRARIAGLLLGTVWVWMLNQGRVVALFYAYRSDRELFALLHGTLAPLVLVACAFVLLLRADGAHRGAA